MELHRVDVSAKRSRDQSFEIIQWMEVHLGLTAKDWMWSSVRGPVYPEYRTAYFFKEPDHALLFKLAWSDISGTGDSPTV